MTDTRLTKLCEQELTVEIKFEDWDTTEKEMYCNLFLQPEKNDKLN